jgi:hypothetical protein
MDDRILSYSNEKVIEAFCKNYSVSTKEAEDIFLQLMKWFLFCTDSRTENYRNIDDATLIIDEMWHTFILFTPDYFKFCEEHFGYYVHHMPSTNEMLKEQRKQTIEQVETRKRKQYELVYDVLGKDTFVQWYHVYPEKYSIKVLRELKVIVFI